MLDARVISKYLLPLTIFSVPFGAYSIETGLANLSAPNLLILLVFGVFLFEYRRNGVLLSRVEIAVLSLFGLLAVQQAVSTLVHSGSPRRLVTFLGYLLFVTAVFVYVDSDRDLKRLLGAAFVSAIFISLLTIVHILLHPNGLPFGAEYSYGSGRTIAGYTIPFKRSLGVQVSYGAFGMYTMMATPYFAYRGLKRRSIPILLGVLVVLAGIAMAQSRSTWAATGVAIFIVMVGYTLGSSSRYVRYAGVVGTIVGTAAVPTLGRILITADSSTVDMRIDQYQQGIDIVVNNPWLGVGFGNLDQYYTGVVAIHSAFLNLTIRTGILALGLVLVIWGVTLAVLAKGMFASEGRLALSVGMFGSLTAMLVESNLQPGFTKAPWIALAFALAAYSPYALHSARASDSATDTELNEAVGETTRSD